MEIHFQVTKSHEKSSLLTPQRGRFPPAPSLAPGITSVPYAAIVAKLGDVGKHLNKDNLSRWGNGAQAPVAKIFVTRIDPIGMIRL